MENNTLFQRLGGTSGVGAIVEDIVEAHMEHPEIRQRFLPYRDDPDKLGLLKRHLCAFMTMGSGGPNAYGGRSMADAHRGMNISDGEYMAAIDDIMMVLDKHSIDEISKREVLAIVYSLKSDITRL